MPSVGAAQGRPVHGHPLGPQPHRGTPDHGEMFQPLSLVHIFEQFSRYRKGGFIVCCKVPYVDPETLSVALRAHPIFFNYPFINFPWFDFAPYLLVHCLLCT